MENTEAIILMSCLNEVKPLYQPVLQADKTEDDSWCHVYCTGVRHAISKTRNPNRHLRGYTENNRTLYSLLFFATTQYQMKSIAVGGVPVGKPHAMPPHKIWRCK